MQLLQHFMQAANAVCHSLGLC
ncbi:hypothetical protein ABTJ92_21430 [Acinetobacter baumannii]